MRAPLRLALLALTLLALLAACAHTPGATLRVTPAADGDTVTLIRAADGATVAEALAPASFAGLLAGRYVVVSAGEGPPVHLTVALREGETRHLEVAPTLELLRGPPPGSGSGGGGGHVETAGNNLSFPVLFTDGDPVALRGTVGTEVFGGATWYVWTDADGDHACLSSECTPPDGVTYQTVYPQQDPDNEWQADNDGDLGAVAVSWVDWGDNLEARSWPLNSKLRVETVLLRDLATPMTAYEMVHLYGQGTSEMWGTTGTTYDSTQATVYSDCARLLIQRLDGPREELQPGDVVWDATASRWTGKIGAPLVDGGVWEHIDGPGGYSAEVNIPGKVIYGYNWNVRGTNDGAGDYRITFALDGVACPYTVQADLSSAQVFLPAEETAEVTAEEGDETGSDTEGATALVQGGDQLTYIDVRITSRRR